MSIKRVAIVGRVEKPIELSYSWFVRTTYLGLKALGYEVSGINYKENSLDKIGKFLINYKPDVVFTHLTFHKHKPVQDVLDLFDHFRNTLGVRFVHSLQDARTTPRGNMDISDVFDCALLGHQENTQKFEKIWKVPVHYFPYSCLPYRKMAPSIPAYKYESPLFVGSPNAHEDRKMFIQKLSKILPLKIIKIGSPEDIKNKTWEVSANARCILGLCTGYDINLYQDCRPWQFLGAGAFMIIRKFKGMDDIIPPDLYIPFNAYSPSAAKFVKKEYERWNPARTLAMREKAFNFMQQNHTCIHRMKQVMEVLEGKRETTNYLLGSKK